MKKEIIRPALAIGASIAAIGGGVVAIADARSRNDDSNQQVERCYQKARPALTPAEAQDCSDGVNRDEVAFVELALGGIGIVGGLGVGGRAAVNLGRALGHDGSETLPRPTDTHQPIV